MERRNGCIHLVSGEGDVLMLNKEHMWVGEGGGEGKERKSHIYFVKLLLEVRRTNSCEP
jgi:N-dimethylarginine dimethylaminohydrolase